MPLFHMLFEIRYFYTFEYNICVKMQDLLSQLEQIGNCKELMRQACKRNGLNTALAGELTIAKVKLFSERFKKAYSTLLDKIKTTWIENELKTYNWLLLAISALENAKISDFGQKQWILLQNIFQFKTRNFLKFEARRFLQEKKSKNRNWSDQQNRLLLKIVNELQSKNELKGQNEDEKEELQMEENSFSSQKKPLQKQKNTDKKERVHWNQVARTLFEQSHEIYFRSGKHCRERWYNYIDPKIERGKWKEEQDGLLMELVKDKGNKWAEIATILHRTQHNVKNRFHALQIRTKKDQKRKSSQSTKRLQDTYQEPKINVFPVKQDSFKMPMMTVTQFSDKPGSKQCKSEIQFQSFLEDVDNLPQTYRTQDQNRFGKGDFSFFTYSPHNLTPLMGSPSPLTFNINGFAYSQKSFNDAYFKNDNMLPGEKQ